MTTPSSAHKALQNLIPLLDPSQRELVAELLDARDLESMQVLGDEIVTEYLFDTDLS